MIIIMNIIWILYEFQKDSTITTESFQIIFPLNTDAAKALTFH